MELLLAGLVIVLLLAAFKHRPKKPSRRPEQDAAEECARLAEEIRWAHEAALKYPPGTAERRSRVEKAREKLEQIERIASGHPEIALRGLEALRQQLREAMAAPTAVTPVEKKPRLDSGQVMVCLLDTETTGLSHSDEPISLAMLLLEIELPKGRLVREVDQVYELREPSAPIHPRAAAVHGLTLKELRGKRFDEARIRSVLERADILIAHNAHFDRRMLARVMPEVEGLSWRCSVRNISWPTENKKLDTVCRHFNIRRPEPHNSMSDVRALADCLLQPTGKTARSRSYLAGCLQRSPV